MEVQDNRILSWIIVDFEEAVGLCGRLGNGGGRCMLGE